MSGAQKSEIASGELVAPTVRTMQSFKDLTTLQLYCPQVAKEWSPRNAPLKPTQVTPMQSEVCGNANRP